MSSHSTVAGSATAFRLSLDKCSNEKLMITALLLQHSEDDIKHARLAVTLCLASRGMHAPCDQQALLRSATSAGFAAEAAVQMQITTTKEQKFRSCIKLVDPAAVCRDVELALLENDKLLLTASAEAGQAELPALQDAAGPSEMAKGDAQPANTTAPLTEAEKEAMVYVNNDDHPFLWDELCLGLKTARDRISYPPDFHEQIAMGQATRDYESANFPLVVAFEKHCFGSNEHDDPCKALNAHRDSFPVFNAEGLVDAQGNATQAFKDQFMARVTLKNQCVQRDLKAQARLAAAARFANAEAERDQREAVKEQAAFKKAVESPRDPVKRARGED